MTTIATDGKSMAADGQRDHGGTISNRQAQKIRGLPDGSLIGTAGDVSFGTKVVEWLKTGATDDPPSSCGDAGFTALITKTDGTVYIMGEDCRAIRIEAPYAIGSGMDLAIGAMAAGAVPSEAVRIACRYDPHSGGTITQESVAK